MKPLSGLDAAFLYAETPTTPMNVMVTVILDGPVAFEEIVARVAERLPQLPPFRRRLLEAPLSLDHPMWLEDPDFDVREHVTRVTAPAPGGDEELEGVVGQLARRRLDRARPLWELTVVDGLAGGRTALVVKAHHAALDGVSGAAMLLHFFDRAGDDESDRTAADPWTPEAEPSAGELVGRSLARWRQRPLAVADALRCAGQSAADLARAHLSPSAPIRDAALPFQAPEVPINGPLSGRRSVAYARTELARVQHVRAAFGGTLNDVVLAACARALQGELRARDALCEQPLVAAVPVSTRTSGDPADCGNRISAWLTELPVQLEDPLHQLSEVTRASRRSKRFHSALGERTLASLAELAVPGLASRAFQLYARWKLASLHRPLFNLVVSNVPGPPLPLSLLGRSVHALHPHGPLLEGVGLNITVLSYAGSLDVGVLACRERVPEARRLAQGIVQAIEEMAKLADAAIPDVPPLARCVA